jgi:hypothetical protein
MIADDADDGDPLDAGYRRAFQARADAEWTDARTRALLGDKRLPIRPREGALLLRALGLLDRHARLPPARTPKYFQINHMLLLIAADLRRRVEAERTARPRLDLVDAGCGRSYLSLLVAWWARGALDAEVRVLGVDRSSKALASCARRAAAAGLGEVMRFVPGELGSVALDDVWAEAFGAPRARPLDALLALHACDTATCDAIVLGVRHDAALIAVAPCCQAELARAWAALDARAPANGLRAVHAHPHLRREVGAHVTDALRATLLGAAGYRATPMELVESEHTPKNTLLRAVRDEAVDRAAAWADHDALVAATGGARLALAARVEALRPRG